MANLFRAFLFKLKRDLTFRITLFIGIGMAVIMTLGFLAYDVLSSLDGGEFDIRYCCGQNLLINTLNPANNFGLVIPVLLTVFTVSEFSAGTIRNKIITGNSKTKIYFSIWLSGLIFTFAVIIAYVGLCVGLSSIVGGFDVNGTIFATSSLSSTLNTLMYNPHITGNLIWKIIVSGIVIYIFVTSMTVFFSTLFRNIGPCIPIIIVLLIIFSTSSLIVNIFAMADAEEEFAKNLIMTSRWINPLFGLDSYSIQKVGDNEYVYVIENGNLLIHIACNMIYSTLFTLGGWLIFRKRDVK